jgi:hypothetical protein
LRVKRLAGGICQKRRINHIDSLRKSCAGGTQRSGAGKR